MAAGSVGSSPAVQGGRPRRWLIGGAAVGLLAGLLIAAFGSGQHASSNSPLGIGPQAIPAFRAGGKTQSAIQYTPGACQRFAPTHGNQHHVVFIDPGHGGPDPGTSGTTQDGQTVYEKTVTLAVALDLKNILVSQGYTVVLSRTRDESVLLLRPGDTINGSYTDVADQQDLIARVDCANASGAQLLLSIHFNTFDDPTIGGTETYYDQVRSFAARNQRFAGLVEKDVLASLAAYGAQVPNRGIAPDTSDAEPAPTLQGVDYPYLLLLGPAQAGVISEPSQMPGALCEGLFLSDPAEASIAASPAGQQAIARGDAAAIEAYFAGSAASGS